MSSQDTTHSSNRRHRIEGPKNHYLTFILSIFLTAFAFFAALYEGLDKMFIGSFILILAIVQAAFQMFFWMHAKDRGHFYPVFFLTGGAFVAATLVIAALYLMWW